MNGMMGFVLCELLECDVESLRGHGIYKAMERERSVRELYEID